MNDTISYGERTLVCRGLFGDIRCSSYFSLSVSLLLNFLRSPYRILDDAGGAFAMGAIGGSIFAGVKGHRNAPPVSISYCAMISCQCVNFVP